MAESSPLVICYHSVSSVWPNPTAVSPDVLAKQLSLLRVRGYDPPHFDPHLTLNFKTNNTLSFVYSKLVRHKVGAGVKPGKICVSARSERRRWRASTAASALR